MSEAERLGPRQAPFADHERREIDLSSLERRGPADAPVEVLACLDLADPFCRAAQRRMSEIQSELPEDVALHLRPYSKVLDNTQVAADRGRMPARTQIARTKAIARALVAAERQGKLWDLQDALLSAQPDQYTREGLERLAAGVPGLDLDTWTRQRDDEETEAAIADHRRACTELGVDRSVPVFFINGRKMPGAIPEGPMRYVVEVEKYGGFEQLPEK